MATLPAEIRDAATGGRLRLYTVPAGAAGRHRRRARRPPRRAPPGRADRQPWPPTGRLDRHPAQAPPGPPRRPRRDGRTRGPDAPAVELRLDALQAGFDRLHAVDPAPLRRPPRAPLRGAGESGAEADQVTVPAAARRRRQGRRRPRQPPRLLGPHRRFSTAGGETADARRRPGAGGGARCRRSPPSLRDHSAARAACCPPSTRPGAPAAAPAGSPAPTPPWRRWRPAPAPCSTTAWPAPASAGRSADALRMVAGKLAAGVGEALTAGRRRSGRPALRRRPRPPPRALAAARRAQGGGAGGLGGACARRSPTCRWPRPRCGATDLFALAVDPDACKGCGLCVAVCTPEALTAAADSPARGRAGARPLAPGRRAAAAHRGRPGAGAARIRTPARSPPPSPAPRRAR